jgi:hypothetical protein
MSDNDDNIPSFDSPMLGAENAILPGSIEQQSIDEDKAFRVNLWLLLGTL